MRGTRLSYAIGEILLRFIPAHAGNTVAVTPDIAEYAVHPRACGEHYCRLDSTISAIGSSPRMRGTRFLVVRRVIVFRFIPAHAGNTYVASKRGAVVTVHPRACGEH